MTQQINLLNPALIRPRDWVSLKNVAVIYAVAILGMYLMYQLSQADLDALQLNRNTAVSKYEAAQVALITSKTKSNKQMNVLEQEQELQTLNKKLEMQNALVASFKYLQADNGHHILDVMQGFASQRVPGVWVTGFKLNAFEKNMAVSGRALQAEAVPQFLEQLGKAAVFKGQLFSGLKMQSVTLFEAAAPSGATVSAVSNALSPNPPVSTAASTVGVTRPANDAPATPVTATPNPPAVTPPSASNPAITPAKPMLKSLPVIEFEVTGYVQEVGEGLPATADQQRKGDVRG